MFKIPISKDNFKSNINITIELYNNTIKSNQIDNNAYNKCFDYSQEILKFIENMNRFELEDSRDEIKEIFLISADILIKTFNLSSNINNLTDNQKYLVDTSIIYLERVLNIETYNKNAQLLYSSISLYKYKYLEKLEDKINVLEKSLLVNPTDLETNFIIACLYASKGDYMSVFKHVNITISTADLILQIKENINVKEVEGYKVKCYTIMSQYYYSIFEYHKSMYYLFEAIKLQPNNPDINNNLGIIYLKLDNNIKCRYHIKIAIDNYELTYMPNKINFLSSLYINTANTFLNTNDFKTAIEYYDKALEICTDNISAYQNKVFISIYLLYTYENPMYITNLHKEINNFYPSLITDYKLSLPYYKPNKKILEWNGKIKSQLIKQTKLNIGIVGGSFISSYTMHSVSFFINTILYNINYKLFNITCYSSVPIDTKPISLQTIFPKIQCKYIKDVKTSDVCNMIINDKIDILIDIDGNTENNRLDVFAMKPAPIQISYCGYPNTIGLLNMDYHIVDKYCDSDGITPGAGGIVYPSTQKYYTEKLIFMDQCFLSYTPYLKENVPKIKEQPCVKNNYLTIGTFNKFNKYNYKVVALWEAILKRCPNVKLLIKSKEFVKDFSKEYSRNKFNDMFNDKSVLDRIVFMSYCNTYYENLDAYNNLDIALDTFPYSGTTTTCEAMYMGVPVITLFDNKNNYHVQNVSSSIMINSGMPEYVCMTEDEYIEKVVYYANNLEELRGLKQKVQKKFIDTICNYPRFTNEFEDKMLKIYREHDW